MNIKEIDFYDDIILYKDYLILQKDSIISDMKDNLNNLLTNNNT
jgi:hypothetical protein